MMSKSDWVFLGGEGFGGRKGRGREREREERRDTGMSRASNLRRGGVSVCGGGIWDVKILIPGF